MTDTYVVTIYWRICASVSIFPRKAFIVPWYSFNPATSALLSLPDLVVEVACNFVRDSSRSAVREPKRKVGSVVRWRRIVINDRSSVVEMLLKEGVHKCRGKNEEEKRSGSRTRKRTTAARTQLFASHGRGRLIKEALVRLSALRPFICMDAMRWWPGIRTCAISTGDDGGRSYCK